jgi:hypothetical protein
MSNPILDADQLNLNPQDREFENSIRPTAIDAFSGQPS